MERTKEHTWLLFVDFPRGHMTSRDVTCCRRDTFIYNICNIVMNSTQQPPQNIKSMDFHALCVDCCELPWTKNLWKSMASPWTRGLFTPKSMEFGHYCGLFVDFPWTFCRQNLQFCSRSHSKSKSPWEVHRKSTKVHGHTKVHGVHGVHME